MLPILSGWTLGLPNHQGNPFRCFQVVPAGYKPKKWLKGNWEFHDFSEKMIVHYLFHIFAMLMFWCKSQLQACLSNMCVCEKRRNNKNLMEITSKPFERRLSQKSEPPSFYTDFHLDLMAKLSQNGKLPAPNINKSSLKKCWTCISTNKPSSNSTHTIRIWRKTHTRLHKYTQPITQFTMPHWQQINFQEHGSGALAAGRKSTQPAQLPGRGITGGWGSWGDTRIKSWGIWEFGDMFFWWGGREIWAWDDFERIYPP